jgi:hypothetical protein
VKRRTVWLVLVGMKVASVAIGISEWHHVANFAVYGGIALLCHWCWEPQA